MKDISDSIQLLEEDGFVLDYQINGQIVYKKEIVDNGIFLYIRFYMSDPFSIHFVWNGRNGIGFNIWGKIKNMLKQACNYVMTTAKENNYYSDYRNDGIVYYSVEHQKDKDGDFFYMRNLGTQHKLNSVFSSELAIRLRKRGINT